MSESLNIANGFAVYERMENGWEYCDASSSSDAEDACREVAARKWARGSHHMLAVNGAGGWEYKVTINVAPVPPSEGEEGT